MFEYAIKAHLPIISATCDDLMNARALIELHAKNKKTAPWPQAKSVELQSKIVYVAHEDQMVDEVTYKRLLDVETSLVLLNCQSKSPLVFDGGEIPTPDEVLRGYLSESVHQSHLQSVAQLLKGMSVKKASEIVQLSGAMYGEVTPKSVSAVRMRLVGNTPGLTPLDTEVGFWMPPVEVQKWIEVNMDYMTTSKKELLPRGLMLAGPPGVGKSMAARAVAKCLGVQAFRLDIATTLNRYIGESEARVQRALDTVLKYAPCVLLIDEVEKVFTKGEDSGTTTRMMSQLLWWLQEREVALPVIMTTNDLSVIPPELYRPGRLDKVVHLRLLKLEEARELAVKVFIQVVGKAPLAKQHKALRDLFQAGDPELACFAHSQVHEGVCAEIKFQGWA